MKKRIYEKPSMKVLELKQQSQLLAASGTNGSRSKYGEPTEWEWN